MNRNDDFDRTLGAWLRGQAPQQAPDRVLDAALERVEGESQRRSWLQRLIGGTPMTIMTRAAAVAAVVAIAALIGFQLNNLIGNIGSSPSPSASPTTDASPSSPSPSDDAAGSLVLRLMGGGEAGRVHLLTVLDDGRIITSDDQGVYVERRLTAAGVQLLRDELDATGLTDTSADYSPVANPGVEPPAYGGAGAIPRGRAARWGHGGYHLVPIRRYRAGLLPATARSRDARSSPGPADNARRVASRERLGRFERQTLRA